jgi:prepilin-type N-terminal cleavage/methylation domain-containing protein
MITPMKRSLQHPYARGFTLIEMMVSVAIFAIVMTSVAAAYLNLVNLDHQARATNDVVNNLSFALDSMSRAIRTGTNYNCGSPTGGNCATSPSSKFVFTDSSDNTITYLLTDHHQIAECINVSPCNSDTATAFTDPRIDISTLLFSVTGVGTGDGYQPTVVFTINGTLTDTANTSANFTIETTSTERGIDI